MTLVSLATPALLVFLFLSIGLWDKGRRGFVLAIRSLWLHRMRAFLSVLGIIIGTAAVIALMAFGEGSMQDALEDIRRMGANNIMVRSIKPTETANTSQRSWVAIYGLTFADFEKIATIPCISRMVPMRIFPQEARRGYRGVNSRVVATIPEFLDIHNLDVKIGRFINGDDDFHLRNVAVLGSKLASRLFSFEDPIGKEIQLGTFYYRVVGILKEHSQGGSIGSEDPNLDVIIPMNTAKVRFGEKIFQRTSGSRSAEKVDISQITLSVTDIDKVRPTGDIIRRILETHTKQDFTVSIPLDRLEEAERAKERYKLLLVLIASISLVVGGIGIMNIMLATVTERTREIGIRRALGAKQRDITLQFLIEAVVQTSLGGLLGIGLGLGMVLALPWITETFLATRLPSKVHFDSISWSLATAVGVGLIFGIYPSRRAALMDPIEALRHV
ncbi:MAG: FtsX-like permease family protein [Gemmataceae bacterium]|nr:FtsX-like permease family protein [Gemmataceae bacterium]